MKSTIKIVRETLYGGTVLNSFFPYKLQSFSNVWNPYGEKVIEKKLLSKISLYVRTLLWLGILIMLLPPLSREIYILGFAHYDYSVTFKNNHFMTIYLDISHIYKDFSHLISSEDFSNILNEILEILDLWQINSWSGNYKGGTPFEVLFLAKDQAFLTLSQEGELWIPQDPSTWESILYEMREHFEFSLSLKTRTLPKQEFFSIFLSLNEPLLEKIDGLVA